MATLWIFNEIFKIVCFVCPLFLNWAYVWHLIFAICPIYAYILRIANQSYKNRRFTETGRWKCYFAIFGSFIFPILTRLLPTIYETSTIYVEIFEDLAILASKMAVLSTFIEIFKTAHYKLKLQKSAVYGNWLLKVLLCGFR